jgi:hypothetical protein
VTGSHPSDAENPLVLQPGLSPEVMSWRTPGLAYNVGLTNPTVDFPAAIRSSLIRLRIAAKTGAAADVPPISVGRPISILN